MYGKLFLLLSWYFLCFEAHYKYLLMQHFIKKHNACFACYSLDICNNFYYYNNISHYRKILGYLNISFASSLLLPASSPPTTSLLLFSIVPLCACMIESYYWVTLFCSLQILGCVWSGHLKMEEKCCKFLTGLRKKSHTKPPPNQKAPQALAKAFVIFSRFSFNVWGHMALHILCS